MFVGVDSLYWDTAVAYDTKIDFDTKIESGDYFFDKWPKQFTGAALFSGDPHYTEPVQGGAGTCYIMQALAGIAEFPELIKDVFLTQE